MIICEQLLKLRLGVHNHFYVAMANVQEALACQWNDSPKSLNSGGVDYFPYIIGGGWIPNSATGIYIDI